MQTGKLRNQVTIERKDGARDADGGERVTWVDVVTVWASIEPVSAREFLGSNQLQSEITGKITMRHPVDVRADDRITCAGVAYGVVAVLPDQRKRAVVAMVTSGVTDGR